MKFVGVIEIPVDKLILSDRVNVRRFIGDITRLKESIRRVGILQPIVVRRSHEKPEGYEVICGRRRVLAVKELLKEGYTIEKLPAILIEASDKEAIILSLSENRIRGDLNPQEIGEALRVLKEEYGMREEEVSQYLSEKVVELKRLLELARIAGGLGTRVIEKAGRWRQRVEVEGVRVEEVGIPRSIAELLNEIVDWVKAWKLIDVNEEEELRKWLLRRGAGLRQWHIMRLRELVRRELRRKKGKVDVKEFLDKSITTLSKKRLLKALVDRTYLDMVKSYAQTKGLTIDHVIEEALREYLDRRKAMTSL